MDSEEEREREQCSACGFDSDLYGRGDTISSQRIVPAALQAAADGLQADLMGERPNDSTWSIAEYTDHVRETAFGNRFAIECGLADPGIDLGQLPYNSINAEQRAVDHARALRGVAREFEELQTLLTALDDDQWRVPVRLNGRRRTVGWFARHVLHDGLHHMADIGRIRHGFGQGANRETGAVVQLNVSDGGVPKRPVDAVEITPGGVAGDAQADRRHHGRPVQAVCLWSGDVIAALQAEGHPIAPGQAGENVTVSGIDWAALRPGSRIDIGPVPMLISSHAIPCSKNAQWFADRDFNRILHRENPGHSRLYAIPLGSGRVAAGDLVVVEPRMVDAG